VKRAGLVDVIRINCKEPLREAGVALLLPPLLLLSSFATALRLSITLLLTTYCYCNHDEYD
jgi:hypothetical protein